MPQVMGKTRGGADWEPQFITAIDQAHCMGCGRCYKVCPRQVFALIEQGCDDDNEPLYYDFSDQTRMVMSLANADDCIGCGACYRVCVKGCHQHTAASLL